MSLGTWEPNDAEKITAKSIDKQQLEVFASFSQNDLKALDSRMSTDQLQQKFLMQLPREAWNEQLLDEFSIEQLLALIRFFTIAEEKLPGWEAGEKSPVIAISKHLKKKGHKLEQSDLEWIRQNSNNRYLPNGPIL